MKQIFYVLLFCFPVSTFSQNLTGTWEGSGGGVTYIKMVIKHVGDSVYGYTYDEGGGYCKATFAARYTRRDVRLEGRGLKMLANSGSHVLTNYDLLYSKDPRGEFLRENTGEANFLERLFGDNESRQYLKKVSNKTDLAKTPANSKPAPPAITKKNAETKVSPPVVSKPVKKEPAVIIPKPPVKSEPTDKNVVLKRDQTPPIIATVPKTERKETPVAILQKKNERSSKLVETIFTSADTVKMFVYDNGEVDGDTVTLFFDNAIILDRYRISEKGKELVLPISGNGRQHVIELFANNLGSIPPNTALLIIVAGKSRYELRASYDLQTNAKIIIQYQE
jgi:hypothetical protein